MKNWGQQFYENPKCLWDEITFLDLGKTSSLPFIRLTMNCSILTYFETEAPIHPGYNLGYKSVICEENTSLIGKTSLDQVVGYKLSTGRSQLKYFEISVFYMI